MAKGQAAEAKTEVGLTGVMMSQVSNRHVLESGLRALVDVARGSIWGVRMTPPAADPEAAMKTAPAIPMWVRQEDDRGCGFAACAMIAGISYADAKAWFVPRMSEAIYRQYLDDALTDHGFALARKFQFRFGLEEKDWPPAPFADAHLCEVLVSESSPINHFVVLLRDGSVLDPLTPEPKRLADYHRVYNVAAVYQVSQ